VNRDSSVGIALGYGLDDWGSRVRLPAGAGNFSLHHRVQTGSGPHPASYSMATRTNIHFKILSTVEKNIRTVHWMALVLAHLEFFCNHHPEDGSSKVLRIISTLTYYCTASRSRRLRWFSPDVGLFSGLWYRAKIDCTTDVSDMYIIHNSFFHSVCFPFYILSHI
jgi:hypothetical protein